MADIAAHPPLSAGAAEYPVDLDLEAPLEVARWRPFVHWFLAIPHHLVSWALRSLAGILAFIAFFAILFTKRYPESMFNVVAMAARYQWRVNSYVGFMRESYPPFEFDPVATDPRTDPATFSIAYPSELNRWLPLVKWFLAIPHYVVVLIRTVLTVFVALAAAFVVLFTGRYNERMRTYLIDVARYQARVSAYLMLMRDEYPPFTMK